MTSRHARLLAFLYGVFGSERYDKHWESERERMLHGERLCFLLLYLLRLLHVVIYLKNLVLVGWWALSELFVKELFFS